MSPDDYNQYMDVIDYYRTTCAAYEMDRKESYAKGAKEEKIKNAKAMREENIPLATIAIVTGLSLCKRLHIHKYEWLSTMIKCSNNCV